MKMTALIEDGFMLSHLKESLKLSSPFLKPLMPPLVCLCSENECVELACGSNTPCFRGVICYFVLFHVAHVDL